MVNSKIIGAIIAVIIISVIGFAFSQSSNNENKTDSSEIITNLDVQISDSAALSQSENSNPDYSVDENGNKRYVISVKDSPNLDDWLDFHMGSNNF